MFDDPRQRNPIPQPPYSGPGLAGVLTFACLWLIMNPLYRNGFISKGWGTACLVAAAAIAYVVVNWWCKTKGADHLIEIELERPTGEFFSQLCQIERENNAGSEDADNVRLWHLADIGLFAAHVCF